MITFCSMMSNISGQTFTKEVSFTIQIFHSMQCNITAWRKKIFECHKSLNFNTTEMYLDFSYKYCINILNKAWNGNSYCDCLGVRSAYISWNTRTNTMYIHMHHELVFAQHIDVTIHRTMPDSQTTCRIFMHMHTDYVYTVHVFGQKKLSNADILYKFYYHYYCYIYNCTIIHNINS